MIGEAHDDIGVPVAERRDDAELELLDGGRVRGRALEHAQARVDGEHRFDRPVDVLQRRAARGQHHRLPERSDVPQQWRVLKVAGRDLVRGQIELLEHVGARLVERRREEHQVELDGEVAELTECVAVELQRLAVLAVRRTEAVLVVVRALVEGASEESPVVALLQLDRVDARLLRRPEELLRLLEAPLVVVADLRDDEAAGVVGDAAAVDRQLAHRRDRTAAGSAGSARAVWPSHTRTTIRECRPPPNGPSRTPPGRSGSRSPNHGNLARGAMRDAQPHYDLQLEVLETLADARNYNDWVSSLAFPYLGDDPLEIGSGLGDQAALWLERGLHPDHRERPRAAVRRGARTAVLGGRAGDGPAHGSGRQRSFVVQLRRRDQRPGARRGRRRRPPRARSLVRAGGRVVIFVPGVPVRDVALRPRDRPLPPLHDRLPERPAAGRRSRAAHGSLRQRARACRMGRLHAAAADAPGGRRARPCLGPGDHSDRPPPRAATPAAFGQSVFAVAARTGP